MISSSASSRKMRVLIADDFAAFRSFVRLKLHKNGFQTVAEAADGLEAVVKAAELQPDLVLLDIGMPKLNGIEAATRIHAIAPLAKVLFVSQNTDADVVRSALSDGAVGYVHKSDVDHELLPAIDAVFGGEDLSVAAWVLRELTVETDLFEHLEVKPHFINPCCF